MAVLKMPTWSLEKRNGTYAIRFRWEGTKPRIPLGLGNEKEAETEAQKWMDKWFEGEQVKAAQAEAAAKIAQQEKSKHPAREWLNRYLHAHFIRNRLNPKTEAEARRNLETLLDLSRAEFLEDFGGEKVYDALAEAKARMTPKKRFGNNGELSGWTEYALVKTWRGFFKWLTEDAVENDKPLVRADGSEIVSPRAWRKLKASIPKAEDKQEELWYLSEFNGILKLASDLDKELLAVLRFMGIDPADIKEMQRGHFISEGRKWRFVKDRAKKAKSKTGKYSQVVDDRALKVLLPRIQIDEDKSRFIFPELDNYKDADSFVSALGNRNDDYWDMFTFNCAKEQLTEVRKGKGYQKRIAELPMKTIDRKVVTKDGRTVISKRAFNGGAKALPNSPAYMKKRRVKVIHSLRYTYATAKSEAGVPLNELRPAMGHAKDSRVLERFYDHPRSEEARETDPLE